MRLLTPRRACVVTRSEDPFFNFSRDFDRLMSTFFGGVERPVARSRNFPFGVGFPKMDVIENEENVKVFKSG